MSTKPQSRIRLTALLTSGAFLSFTLFPPPVVAFLHSPVTSTSASWSMTYDADGNLVSKDFTQSPHHLLTPSLYSYDAENRLVEVKTAPEETVTVTFHPGWNFFSLPVIPEKTSVSAVLPNFSANFEQVARLAPSPEPSAPSQFEHYVGNAKFDDFSTLEYGVGYQVYCKATSDVTVTLKGKLPTKPLGQSVAAGWHLLPATRLQTSDISQVFGGIDDDQILTYDAAAAVLKPATEVAAAQAYYVHVRTAGTFSPSLPRDPTTRFIYDGDGGKVKQITPAGTTLLLGELFEVKPDGTQVSYIFAGSQRIASLETTPAQLASLKPAESPTRLAKAWHRLLDFLDIPSAEAAGLPVLHFYLMDHLGSTDLVTDATGAVIEHTEHVPYGAIARHDGPADLPHKFTGQRQDGVNGLVLFPARPYDPELGRFLQPDPFVQDPSDPQTLNRYSYVRNNPVNFVDPSGNFSLMKLIAGIVLAFVAVVAAVVGVMLLIAGQPELAVGVFKIAAWAAVGSYLSFSAAFRDSSSSQASSSPRGPPSALDPGQQASPTFGAPTASWGATVNPVAAQQINNTTQDLGLSNKAAQVIQDALRRPFSPNRRFTDVQPPSVLGPYRVQPSPQAFNNDPIIYQNTQFMAYGVGIFRGRGLNIQPIGTGEAFQGSTRILVYGDPVTMQPSSWVAAVYDEVDYIPSIGSPLYGWRVVDEQHARSLGITYKTESYFRNRQFQNRSRR